MTTEIPFAQTTVSPSKSATSEPTREEMAAMIAALKAENDKLTKAKTLTGGIKVSEKGAVSVYGLGRFPVTLYKEQWLRLFTMTDAIKAFIVANDKLLKAKE